MKQLYKVFAMLLVLAFLCTGCGSKAERYAAKVAATYGEDNIYLNEANF